MRTGTGASGLKKEEKRRKWHSLWGQICDRRNVEAAWRRVRRNRGAPGIDGVTVEEFEDRAIEELGRLGRELRDGSYEPLPVRRVMIPKPDGSERVEALPQGDFRNMPTGMFCFQLSMGSPKITCGMSRARR